MSGRPYRLPPPPIFQSAYTKSVVGLGVCPPSQHHSAHFQVPSVDHSASMVSPGCLAHINLADPNPVAGAFVGGTIFSSSRNEASDCQDQLCSRARSALFSADPPSELLNSSAALEPESGLGHVEPSQNSDSLVNSPEFTSNDGRLISISSLASYNSLVCHRRFPLLLIPDLPLSQGILLTTNLAAQASPGPR
ncbi:hypothetical protein Nepgr_021082 [Nepenthes gracilis]|uniref:Uncharacterized protein n=1 Tax=Nepenthes gracilis TaxID=150966 RepID=A0AAD3SYF9_NEPGR|nr:hypothetical protein Nepgr_021082 [Nepenthes gracilis]